MEEMTRLFNLDFQLLHDTVLLAIAIFFLFLALSYLLFNPVRKMLKDRQEKIATISTPHLQIRRMPLL